MVWFGGEWGGSIFGGVRRRAPIGRTGAEALSGAARR